MPLGLQGNTTTSFCIIAYANIPGQRDVTMTFSDAKTDEWWEIKEVIFDVGQMHCDTLSLPPPGDYKIVLRNETGNLHEPVKITLLDSTVTLIQTDKPVYKPGEKVRFRILTMFNMKPKTRQIHSIYIKNSNGLRVKQYLKLTTRGECGIRITVL
ncbi:alpha-2-macroglobulin-like protein [Plakobranchus ocellatus]|uniref:Alpha-2-macroglobulin-like protein n=1 Tax=Plakobranchus ocellatus TaxID=259542 RepID=A0AAV4BG51_9GAST|nr:alpha-2-macroglobulin-like protein [Plakobranchus ocellatus]